MGTQHPVTGENQMRRVAPRSKVSSALTTPRLILLLVVALLFVACGSSDLAKAPSSSSAQDVLSTNNASQIAEALYAEAMQTILCDTAAQAHLAQRFFNGSLQANTYPLSKWERHIRHLGSRCEDPARFVARSVNTQQGTGGEGKYNNIYLEGFFMNPVTGQREGWVQMEWIQLAGDSLVLLDARASK